jgi:acyl-CoA thioesterase-2
MSGSPAGRPAATPAQAPPAQEPPAQEPRALDAFTMSELLAVLNVGGDVPPVPARALASPHGGVLGAQQLGQQIVLSERMTPGKLVHSLHTVFSRPGDYRQPVWIDVERLAHGRSVDALALSFRQDSQHLSRANLMLRAPESGPDLVRHRTTTRITTGPEEGEPEPALGALPWEIRGLPGRHDHQRDYWVRMADAGGDPTVWRALIACSCELLPLADIVIGEGIAAKPLERSAEVTAMVLSLTVSFFDDLDVRDWHLFRIRALHAGYGRTASRVEVFARDGVLQAESEAIGILQAVRS